MAVLLALAAAAAYGLADFVGGVVSQRVSPWSVALAAQLGGAAAVLVLAVLGDGSPTRADLWWTLVAGLGNGTGTAFLYRGLSAGRMGVVAPVSGVGTALLPVLVGIGTGERPGVLAWTGMLVALPAIWLVARAPGDAPDLGVVPSRSGLLDGIAAGIGFGVLFAALAQVPEEAGLLPLALNQLVAAVTIVAVATVMGAPWLPRARRAWLGAVSGCLGALATGLFLVASRGGFLSLAAVITALYPAFTVLLAAGLLRERVHRGQAAGLALCAAAVVLAVVG